MDATTIAAFLPFLRSERSNEETLCRVSRNILAGIRWLRQRRPRRRFPDFGIEFVGVSRAFGLTGLTMACAVGHISGGHFNHLVTLGLAVARRFAWAELPGYWATQVAGGLVAAFRLYTCHIPEGSRAVS